MSGASIAAEVASALREVAGEVGSTAFTVTLRRPPAEPTNPWDTGNYGEPEDFELPAMVSRYPNALVDGTLIQATDKRVMIAATGVEPTTADTLLIADEAHRIVSVRNVAPSGVNLYHECQARR